MSSLRRLLLELRHMDVTPGEIELESDIYEDILEQAREIAGSPDGAAD